MHILVFYIDALDPASKPSFWMLDQDAENITPVTAEFISEMKSPIVTIEPQRLVQYFSSTKVSLPETIVDLSLMQKIIIGRPKGDFSDPLPWDFTSYLSNYMDKSTLARLVDYSLSTREPEEGTLFDVSLTAARAMYKHFNMLNTLAESEEYNYFNFEIELANIFYSVQYNGLKIDRELANSKLAELEDEYYTKLQDLRDANNFKGGVFDSSYISSYLKINSKHFSEVGSLYSISAYLDTYYEVDDLAEKLRTLRRIRLTRTSLLKAVGSSGSRLFPCFDSAGTVTGRILATEPLLQHTRKIDRDFIVADEGYNLLYLDFKEFEPRIVAALSRDPVLLDLIAGGDMYDRLSKELLEELITRDQAKVVMMQLLYNASTKSITKYITNIKDLEEEIVLPKIECLVTSVSALRTWQQNVISEADKNRSIKIPNILPRNFKKEIEFSNRMARQAINHIVQGTGAIILKSAIRTVNKTVPNARILLPMHDAILLQLPLEGFDLYKDQIISILNNTMREVLSLDIGDAIPKSFS